MFAQTTACQSEGASTFAAFSQPRARVARIHAARPGRTGGATLNDQLAAVAQRQDREAFAALFAHFAPRVKAFMLKRGCDAATAEELAQMALITVWEKARLFDPQKASAATWIFTIARNLHIDAIRKTKRPEPDPNDPCFVPAGEKPADAAIAEAQDAARLREAMATLPAEQQEVLRLSFYEEKSHGEISSALGLPLGTVKSRLRLAFGRIRKVIGELE